MEAAKIMKALEAGKFILFNPDTSRVLIRSYLKWNAPASGSNVKAMAKIFDELPDDNLDETFLHMADRVTTDRGLGQFSRESARASGVASRKQGNQDSIPMDTPVVAPVVTPQDAPEDMPEVAPQKQEQEQGMSYAQVTETLSRLLGHTISGRPEVEISLIGIGMSAATLTQEAKRALEESDVVFGAERMLKVVENSKETYPFYLAKDILPVLRQKESKMDGQKLKVSILFSGDTGFYSGTEKIKTELNKNHYKKIRIFPGISSVSYLSAATGIAWQDAKILSIHGKEDTAETRALVLDAIRHFSKTFLLVSGVEDVRRIGCWIEEEKLTQTRMIAGFQLSYDAEKIRELSCEEAKNIKEEGLYTLLLCNENVQKRRLVPGMSDESFLRVVEGEKTVPMTKEEVRALSLCKLGLTEDAVVYDVGSGTGSIAVECATCSPGIRVYAIEQKATAQQLLRRNLEKFHLANVIPVDGKAPEILEPLEPPTHVFIGGSSGRLADILHVIWEKNPRTRVVVNAISLETVAQITELAAGKMQTEIIQVQVSRAKTVGTYHLMQAENPVYICVLTMA